MKLRKTERGFQFLTHEVYPPEPEGAEATILQQSSVIGPYDDALQRPGSSCLWVGDKFHLGREEVGELVARLQAWLATGKLGGGISEDRNINLTAPP